MKFKDIIKMSEPAFLHINGMTCEEDAKKITAELKTIDLFQSGCEYEDNRVFLQSKSDEIEPELIKNVIAKINKLGFEAVEVNNKYTISSMCINILLGVFLQGLTNAVDYFKDKRNEI